MKRRFLGIALSMLMLVACSTTQTPEATKAEKTFFDVTVVENFVIGKTTQEEIRDTLGDPYPEPLKTPERWTYMYTYQKQIIFTFNEGILTEKKWSTEYGIGAGTKQ